MWPEEKFDSKPIAISFYNEVVEYILSLNKDNIVVLNPGSPYFKELMIDKPSNVIAVIFEGP